jgi:hypothetical protein
VQGVIVQFGRTMSATERTDTPLRPFDHSLNGDRADARRSDGALELDQRSLDDELEGAELPGGTSHGPSRIKRSTGNAR